MTNIVESVVNYLYPTSMMAMFSSLTFSPGIVRAEEKVEVVAYETPSMRVVVPEVSLTYGSVQIQPKRSIAHLTDWTEENHREALALVRKVVGTWEKNGIHDYMIYAHESNSNGAAFNWEVVPYPKEGWTFWKQLKVVWRLIFGGTSLSLADRQQVVKDFQANKDQFSERQKNQIKKVDNCVKTILVKPDAFCTPSVIDKQLVFEGHEINVLYNYAPIGVGKDKLHFLLVPKKHREAFTELTPSEYLETIELVQKIIVHYRDKGLYNAYIFDKTGKIAGQTVPHWHEHLVFTASDTQSFFGKLQVLRNIIFRQSPLSKEELQDRVKSLKVELQDVFVQKNQ